MQLHTPLSSNTTSSVDYVIPVILGPTAVGKTDVALRVARELGYEILSCDSRQIYKGMDIGTAKPTSAQLAEVPHRLIDFLSPSMSYSAFNFAADARRTLIELASVGKHCLVCGGTGLYFRALSEGLAPQAESDPELRAQLMERAGSEGGESLHRELQERDAAAAQRIHPNDVQRIVRALLVHYQTGMPQSQLMAAPRDSTGALQFRVAMLTLDRDILYRRIDSRVDTMMRAGLWDEYRRLRAEGFLATSPGLQCVGYKEFFAVDDGSSTMAEAIELIKRNTRRYAKRQMTWFRHQVEGTTIDVAGGSAPVVRTLLSVFSER